MTAAHRATERTPPQLARADRGDPDLMLDRWRFWERIRGLDRRYSIYVDLVLAAAVFALSSWWVFHDDLSKTDLWFSAALAFPLVLRRRLPVPVFAAVAAVALTQWFVTAPLPSDAALLVAVCTVAASSRWVWVLACAAVLETGIVMATVRWIPTGSDVESLVYLTGLAFTALLAGVVIRAVRSQFRWLAERAERLERERDQQASLAAAAERARIAREMHDVVSHNIQVMVTLADGAAAATRSDPSRAADVMSEVSGTGREALTDMRRMLGVLREDPAVGRAVAGPLAPARNGTGPRRTPGHDPAGDANGSGVRSATHPENDVAGTPYAPQPGLAELQALVERVRGTGLHVTLERAGRSFELSAAAQLTVYRLVQEALTNALKHAESPASVEVRLEFDDPDITVRVIDDGRVGALATGYEMQTTAGTGSGHGLSGMAERTTAFGGTLEAGPMHGGGWRVSATLRRCRTPPVP